GLVVRGYVSRIDGSVQPYGLVIPASYRTDSADPFRLDLWFHGRGETLSEVNFLDQRGKQVGVFAPSNGIVLHPYGRYSNANKFAGEIDVLEAIDSVKQRYRIDPDRIVARGFSMGGASAWHLAVHYPGRWAAANPGAGFSETPDFLRTFQQEELNPTWWERKLWHWYDCTDWAGNLFHCPTVAYSGELDRQKQAADIMAVAAAREGIELVHVVGPETAHKYHPDAARDVESRVTELARLGRERVPPVIDFKTYTLRYNKVRWLTIDGLGEHWEPARVSARLQDGRISLTTENVTALTVEFEPGECPFRRTPEIEIESFVNGVRSKHLISELPADVASAGGGLRSDRSARWSLALVGDQWQFGSMPTSELRKRHGLQGPIDDAFMDSFVFVRPTGKCASQMVDDWTQAEMQRAIEHWRRHFRGHPRVKDDRDVTDEDIATMNLVLWGDAAANQVLAKIAERLPIRSSGDSLSVGTQSFGSEHHVPILVYPNPLNPERYVVLNSSFTFREFAYLNNARQVAKLPDWAVIDVRTPANSLWPGKVVAADFFDERWQLKPFRAAKP
ncbi:MAG: prolyl oligopeptidase family serine peptidase, partial [Planctomycetales bacterium]|nr:prolyl oligopeptidase family serine peptidase [Planctomycetales bacterium]